MHVHKLSLEPPGKIFDQQQAKRYCATIDLYSSVENPQKKVKITRTILHGVAEARDSIYNDVANSVINKFAVRFAEETVFKLKSSNGENHTSH